MCKNITQKKFMPLMMLQLSKDICSFYYCTSFRDVTNDVVKIMAQKDNLDVNLHKDESYFLPTVH